MKKASAFTAPAVGVLANTHSPMPAGSGSPATVVASAVFVSDGVASDQVHHIMLRFLLLN